MDQPVPGVKAIFDRALEIDRPADRQAFLEEACAGASTLRDQVESLLRAYAEAGSFLEQPAGAEVRPGLTPPTPAELPLRDASPPAEAPGALLGPYRLVQLLGEGGMGTVWRAEQQAPVRRDVAVKVIKPGYASAGIIARFEAERQALALMDHPHIAKVHDAGETPPAYAGGSPRPFFVMELVEGVPITQLCDERRLSVRQRLELFIPVCQAVQHAHQKGIIHRDLKPSNVLVALYDGKAVPKVIDFGVAKATSSKLTEQTLHTAAGVVVGTLEYMAPEQAEREPLDIDTRADVYSLGVILYELLTGSTPRRGLLQDRALLEMLQLIREHEPERPSTRLRTAETLPGVAAARGSEPARLVRQVRGELDWIVLRCLEKDRSRRYETANGLARDLQRYLADEPVAAGPPGAGYRLRKLARRHKGPVLAAALVLLALLVGITGTTWGLLRADQAREAEAGQRRLAEERKQAAEAKEQEALRQQQIAEAVRKFLTEDLLAEAAPEKNPRQKQVTVEEVLRRAAQKIDNAFAGQPEVEAAVRDTIAVTYRRLGQYADAEPHQRRALELCRELYGRDHPRTMEVVNNLASLLQDRGQLDEAEPLFRENLEVCRRVLGPEHPATLGAINNLARLLQDRGHFDDAELLFRQSLEARRRLGPDHPETLSGANNLAVLLKLRGKFDEAEPLYRESLEASRRILGPDHPGTLQAVNNLAMLLQARGKLKDAEPLFRQNLEASRRILGPDHPRTLMSLQNLAGTYMKTGQYAAAEPLFKEVLEGRRHQLGPDHPETLATVNTLGLLYEHLSRDNEAEPLLQEALERRRRVLGADHADTLRSLNNLGFFYLNRGRYAEAEPLLKAALEGRRRRLGPDHPETLTSLNNLALLYKNLRRYDEAEPLYQEMIERSRQKLGADHPHTLTGQQNLARLYLDTGRRDKAAPLFEEVLARQEAKLGADHPDTLRTMSNLAEAYDAAGRPEKALPLWEHASAKLKEKLGPDHPRTLSTMNKLAAAYKKNRDFAKAETALRVCLALRQHKQPDDWETFATQAQLGASLLDQQKYAEAEPFLLQGYEGMKQREAKLPASAKKSLTATLDRLVQLYDAWGKKDQADAWRQRLAERTSAKAP